ncbi:IucA / IucC family protein [Piscirickettsiaceae bacterium NZ-RLO1]|nr:IucA / IucC family protein [Piscirickettsiaceae bacterium NZ-RLO1]
MKITLQQWREARSTLIFRLLNTFIRENMNGFTTGKIIDIDTIHISKFKLHFKQPIAFNNSHWLQCQFNSQEIIFPIQAYHFMQKWSVTAPIWYLKKNDQYQPSTKIIPLLKTIYQQYPTQEHSSLSLAFAINEYKAATYQTIICNQQAKHSKCIQIHKATPKYFSSLLQYDHIAAFLDHPLYPTARAKLGFNPKDLYHYTTEFKAEFKLNWVAIPKSLSTLSGTLPIFWPSFSSVGLNPTLQQTHTLLPVHPFLIHRLQNLLDEQGIKLKIIKAPVSFLTVNPTLSIRSLSIKNYSHFHLKLPLDIRTLSAKNIRTIKASTINDGHQVQSLLEYIRSQDPELKENICLTTEHTGMHINSHPMLAFILRQYPSQLNSHWIIPIAALCAKNNGQLIIQHLINDHFNKDTNQFMKNYFDLTIHTHLKLWLIYGITLEANQQNSLLVIDPTSKKLSLLFKDNDSPRINSKILTKKLPKSKDYLKKIIDQRILTDSNTTLLQMFTTITLQLNLACIIEPMIAENLITRKQAYNQLAMTIKNKLDQFEQKTLKDQSQGEEKNINISFCKKALLQDDYLYLKHLYTAGTLLPKSTTAAADINKFYGKTAPNFLKWQQL